MLSWGPHQEFHPKRQKNYIAHGRQILIMTDSVSTSLCLADNILILVRAAMNSVPNEILTFSDSLVSRGSHVTCSWQWDMCTWERFGSSVEGVCLLSPFSLISTLSTVMTGGAIPVILKTSWKGEENCRNSGPDTTELMNPTSSCIMWEKLPPGGGKGYGGSWVYLMTELLWGRYLKEGNVG